MRYEKGQPDNRKKRKGYIGVSRATLRALWGDTCFICGGTMLFNPRDSQSGEYATMEHVMPRSKGGGKTWENMRLTHRDCNNEKGDRDMEEYWEWKNSQNK